MAEKDAKTHALPQFSKQQHKHVLLQFTLIQTQHHHYTKRKINYSTFSKSYSITQFFQFNPKVIS